MQGQHDYLWCEDFLHTGGEFGEHMAPRLSWSVLCLQGVDLVAVWIRNGPTDGARRK